MQHDAHMVDYVYFLKPTELDEDASKWDYLIELAYGSNISLDDLIYRMREELIEIDPYTGDIYF